ncbi:phosphoserine phosphatase SerB [Sphingomonas sp. RB56-2]|uniref:Phosphoserine phosphatase n=1 Tax=Sphingomonas brevis TaxID=2908206 RepID=A0ABT0S7J0_9SPHN|nr:phosphoserine phosphatase SerB [Sphingomonas brevis]MCL6740363.1 phosphoserine phosphatase SerB [Sphingomonas brevis]
MPIATLIAAGRLDERLVERIPGARLLRWIDEGDAADVSIDGDIAEAREAIERLEGVDFAIWPVERVPARLFVADMDSTMIGQECIDELADYAGFKDKVAAITERAMRGELDFASALAERVSLLAGLDHTTIEQCLKERISPNPGAATLVATLKSRRVLTVLVSGGFIEFVRPIALQLGFDRMKANYLAVGNEGILIGRTIGKIVDAAAKRRLAEMILSSRKWPAEALMAVGDGANDVPMVELAGLGVAYRAKPALAAVADGRIDHHDLTALLWMQGIPRAEWVEA